MASFELILSGLICVYCTYNFALDSAGVDVPKVCWFFVVVLRDAGTTQTLCLTTFSRNPNPSIARWNAAVDDHMMKEDTCHSSRTTQATDSRRVTDGDPLVVTALVFSTGTASVQETDSPVPASRFRDHRPSRGMSTVRPVHDCPVRTPTR